MYGLWSPAGDSSQGVLRAEVRRARGRVDEGEESGGWKAAEVEERGDFQVRRKDMAQTADPRKVDLFLDSGAYSAHTQGVEIDLPDYIQFIKDHLDHIHVYANLDVIGDAEATAKNQTAMEKAGLSPLPCYHFGEDLSYLKAMLKRYDYIALGGMVGRRSADLAKFLDVCFREICDEKTGLPRVKIHGFGLTSIALMCRYPWYSVDSTTWVMTSRRGSIIVPRRHSDEWVFDEFSWVVSVSGRPQQVVKDHLLYLSPSKRDMVLLYVKEKGYSVGKSSFRKESTKYGLKEGEKWAEPKKDDQTQRMVELVEEPGICNDYRLRDEMCAIYFLDLEEHLPKWPWPFLQKHRNAGGFGL